MVTKDERLEQIDVVRVYDRKVHVLGRRKIKGLFNLIFSDPLNNKYLHEIVHDAETGRVISEEYFRERHSAPVFPGIFVYFVDNRIYSWQRYRKTRNYKNKVEEFKQANTADEERLSGHIPVFQLTIDDLANELGRHIERVDTGKPDKFISAENLIWLRWKARALGANAIAHYQPGSGIGTPVRYDQTK